MSGAAEEQHLLARFLVDPEIEAEVRADPDGAAVRFGVASEIVARIASIDARRVRAFRASRAHKDALRSGAKKPTRMEGGS